MGRSLARLPNSKAFEHGGLYVMRSPALYLLAVCHRTGVHGVGPHKHNDWLSFDLCVNGRPVIVDPGTYCYTGQPELKALFRSTAYHNTVVVDAQEQLRFAPSNFALDHPQGNVRVLHWASDAGYDSLEAEHTGYTRLRHPVVHRRRFELDKQHDRLVITDRFISEGSHTVEWFLHLDHGLHCDVSPGQATVYNAGQPVVRLWMPGGLSAAVHSCWISPAYNRRTEVECLTWQADTRPGENERFEMTFSLEGALGSE